MCSITSLQLGEVATNVAKDMDTYSLTLPIGVTAGITPFNFPAMIPLWMFPVAITCGNTSIIKPSERDPGATMLLMEMLNEAGCPPGVVNVSSSTKRYNNFRLQNLTESIIPFQLGHPRSSRFSELHLRPSRHQSRVIRGFRSGGKIYLRTRRTQWQASAEQHGSKESRCHLGGRQQRAHPESIGGSCIRCRWSALHGLVHRCIRR